MIIAEEKVTLLPWSPSSHKFWWSNVHYEGNAGSLLHTCPFSDMEDDFMIFRWEQKVSRDVALVK